MAFNVHTFFTRHFDLPANEAIQRKENEIFLNEIMEINVIIIIKMGFFAAVAACSFLLPARKLHY